MPEEWRPGSFTKNFSWGRGDVGLRELHKAIRAGFGGRLERVTRADFKARISDISRPWHIPLNFFLYTKREDGVDYVLIDELVFYALNFRYSKQFDKLALFTFHLGRVGQWSGMKAFQSRPTPWARSYLRQRIKRELDWDHRAINANDIEAYMLKSPNYKAETARKLATNLSYLYKLGRIEDFGSKKPERWWVSALFLTLDRIDFDLQSRGEKLSADRFGEALRSDKFFELSGCESLEKEIAASHFLRLYDVCGGRFRFSEVAVRERQETFLPDLNRFANDPDPVGVVHFSNPSAVGAVPRICAMLAVYLAGFETFELDDSLEVSKFVRSGMKTALERLKAERISPRMSAEELLALTRGE